MTLRIDGRAIGPDRPPFLIAELSANHNGSLQAARDLISVAAEAGADAVKLQTYRPDTITLDADGPEFSISGGLWDGQRLFDLYARAHTPWDWHAELFAHARACGIIIFSSPFDTTAVDLLEELGAPAYKIASFEAVDLPLIRYVASKGKPMIISTGMADAEEIAEAVAAARAGGCGDVALLHCVSGYPAPAKDYNLRTIRDMMVRFGVPVGLSDHTLDNVTAIAAIASGACIIEKHVTLDRMGGGPDDSFSLEPAELAALCQCARTAWEAVGKVDYGRKSSESGNVQFRRSLYFVRDLPEGTVIGPEDVRSIRPGFGMAPKHLPEVIGRRLSRAVRFAQPVRPEDLG